MAVALDRTRALNRHAHTAANGHVRAQKKLFCHFEKRKRSRESLDFTSLSFLLEFERCLDFART